MISVALCTYNGEKYIQEQITSILNQTIPADEIIICDDRSTDQTIHKIEEIRKKSEGNTEIRVVVNETNAGVTKNFEKALSLCNGDIVFLSDQDDIWGREKIEHTLAIFEQDPECLLVFSDAALVDSEGKDTGRSLWNLTNPPLKEKYSVLDFTGTRFVTGATAAIRRKLLDYAMPIPGCWIHDAWLAANASVFGRVHYLNQKLIQYRQHEANVIGAKERSFFDQIRYTREHIDKSMTFRTIMKERFTSLLKNTNAKLTTEEKKKMQECIVFWEESEKIGTESRLAGIRTIVKNLRNGTYDQYNHGKKGAMVDLFITVAKPGRGNKNN